MTQRVPIFLATVLLEPNRWAAGKRPTFRASEWSQRIAAAGFDGVELWENHAALASDDEVAALAAGPAPLRVFNSYAALNDAGRDTRARAAALVKRLRCGAVKFNFGPKAEVVDGELLAAREWSASMPGVRMLCECHPGTFMETPTMAAEVARKWPAMEAIVHPFGDPQALRRWLAALPGRITHAHVQMSLDGNSRCRLRAAPQRVREALTILRGEGFLSSERDAGRGAGSFSIEFTEGVGAAPENQEALFAAACDDLAFLRECLS